MNKKMKRIQKLPVGLCSMEKYTNGAIANLGNPVEPYRLGIMLAGILHKLDEIVDILNNEK